MTSFQHKILSLTFILFCISYVSVSQNSFNVTLKDSTYDNMVHCAIETKSGHFIIASARILQLGNFVANILKIDAYGNLLKQQILSFNGNIGALSGIIQISDNRFVLSGGTFTGNSGNLWLCTIDSSLNVVHQKSCRIGSYSIFNAKIKLDYQNNILVFGQVDSSGFSYSFLYKLTSTLDSISCKIYNEDYSNFQDLIERSDHQGYYFMVLGFGIGSAKILALDPNFNIEKITELTDEIANLGTIRLIDPTHYIVCALRIGPIVKEIGVQMYDTLYHLVHYGYYGKVDTNEWPAMVKSIDFTDTSSIFIGGTSYMYDYEFVPIDNWYRMNNIDTAFNLKWEKFYGGDGYYTLYGILATHDGGCLMYGTIWDYHHISDYVRYLKLIKVSKDGLLSDKNGEPGKLAKDVILYPNPGSDRIIIRSALRNLTVTFFDVMGNAVLSEPVQSSTESIDVSGLSPGIYFYRISSGEKVVDTGKWIKE